MDKTPHSKKYNYSGKCATPSHKIDEWFSAHELLRKAKKLNLPSLVYRRARGAMAEICTPTIIVRYLKISDLETVLVQNTTTNWYGKHPKMTWEANFFYFQTIKTWNALPKEIAHTMSINSFKNKLDEAWKHLPIKFYEQERFLRHIFACQFVILE